MADHKVWEEREGHAPVTTHKRKKSKYQRKRAQDISFEPTENREQVEKGPFDHSQIKKLPDFSMSNIEMFPHKNGLYAHGTLKKGIEKLLIEKYLPENISHPWDTDAESRKLLCRLDEIYQKASQLEGLQPAQGEGLPRRFISRSEELPGGSSNPKSSLKKALKEILILEENLARHQKAKRLELENNNISIELLKAIEVANRGIFYHTMGDYFAALSNSFPGNPMWQQIDTSESESEDEVEEDDKNKTDGEANARNRERELKKWKFQGFERFSDLIAAYDQEQEIIQEAVRNGKGHDESKTPLTNDLRKAAEYLGDKYSSVDEIIYILRSYAERNKAVHQVSVYFERGDCAKIHLSILKHERDLPFLGDSQATETYRDEARYCLRLVKKVFFEIWSDEEEGFVAPSQALRAMFDKYLSKIRAKDPLAFREKENLAKAARTREVSRAEAAAETEDFKSETAYEAALAQLGSLAASVLIAMKDREAKLKQEKVMAEENMEHFKKRFENSMKQLADQKAKNKDEVDRERKKLDKQMADHAEEIAAMRRHWEATLAAEKEHLRKDYEWKIKQLEKKLKETQPKI